MCERAPERNEECWCACVIHGQVLAAIKPTQLNDPSGLSSVGLVLNHPNNLLFGGVSSCGNKRRVRSLASLVHYRSDCRTGASRPLAPALGPGVPAEKWANPQGAPELFLRWSKRMFVCVQICECGCARVHRVRKTSASAKAATTSRTTRHKSTLEVTFISCNCQRPFRYDSWIHASIELHVS